jgi:hypothetical protein
MNQTVKITRPGTPDSWGQPVPGQETSYRCRLDQSSELVRGQDGKEVVARASILLDGLVSVGYADSIEFTDEAGNSYKYKPVKISVIRDFAGKPMLTKVVV